MSGLIEYDESPKCAGSSLGPRARTIREKLADQKNGTEERLANINEALAALDKNPEFERLHDLLNRL